MPLSLFDLQQPVSRDSVRAVLERLLTCAGFPVTSWQDDGTARGFVEAGAGLGAEMSVPVSVLAKMATIDGAEDAFLDAKLASDYDEFRAAALKSTIAVKAINVSASTYSPSAGQIIVRASNGRTFSNLAGAVLTNSATTVVNLTAEVGGSAGNITAQTLELVTPFAGVTMVFEGSIISVGADSESDPAYRARARSKWATLRIEKIDQGLLNLVRTTAPAIVGISIDDENPRGPGTVDVYLAGSNATAGGGDVALVQTALNGALFGTGTAVVAGLAIAAPTIALNLAATVFVRGITAESAQTALVNAWSDFVDDIPVGGFDLSPGPQNVVLYGQIIDALTAIDGVISVQITGPVADPISIPLHTKALLGSIAFTIVTLST